MVMRPSFKWRPIETAPKDGQLIIVRRDDFEAMAKWSRELDDWVLGRPGAAPRLT
jgi:hypothetical protein